MIKVVELFAGVGGFRLGLEKSHYKVIWSNQWEPSTKMQHASMVYEARFGKENHSNEDINDLVANNIDAFTRSSQGTGVLGEYLTNSPPAGEARANEHARKTALDAERTAMRDGAIAAHPSASLVQLQGQEAALAQQLRLRLRASLSVGSPKCSLSV